MTSSASSGGGNTRDVGERGDVHVNVYDMDGVITAGDTFGRFVRARMRELGFRHVVRLIKSVVGDIRLGNAGLTRIMVIRAAVVAVLDGLTEEEYQAQALSLAAELASSPEWINRELVDEMRTKRAMGEYVVVATACERRLASAMLDAAGVGFDALSASLLDVDSSRRWTVRDYRIGERKAQALQEAGLDLTTASFTTDSFMDAATAKLCANTAVVCSAESRLVERFTALGIAASRWSPARPSA